MGTNNLKIKPLSRAPNVKPVHKPKEPKKDKKIDPKGTIISTARAMDVQIPNAFPIPKAFPTKGRNNGTKLSLSGDKFDASELTITNGEFKITGGTQGITVLRPEILSLFNFYPIYDNKENNTILNSHGRFLELNFQSSYLQKDSVVELIKNIEKTLEDPTSSNGNIKKQLKSINKISSKDNLENISKILTYESDLLNTLHSIEAAFDIKKY